MFDRDFKNWLVNRGYKEYTPSGNPSTAYDYVKRINFVIEQEHYNSWQNVADNIDFLLREYGETGRKAMLGKKSHNAVISALRRFKEFLEDK